MNRRSIFNLIFLALFPQVACGAASDSKQPQPSLVTKSESPVLIGGRPADPAQFPASVYASMSGARCTATVVGPRVLFIAAHCVNSGGTASFTAGANRYTSVCTHSKDYARNSTADYALCVVDREVTGIKYENVATDSSVVKVGDEILLTGYGCTSPGGGGGNDGVYRIGEARVKQVPSGTDNDIVASSGAALCFGDSGGPAFKYLDAGKTKRVLVSINSRGDIRTTSYLSGVFTDQGKRFIAAWQGANSGLKICGVDADTPNCRDSVVPPPPPPEGPKCKAEVESFGKVKDELDAKYRALFDCLAK